MYNKVPTDLNFVSREREVARLWKEKDVIHKSFDLRKGGEHFTFFDGPPTANGKPHIGHIETRVIKDLFPRFWTMKGKNVTAQGGLGYPRPARGAGSGKGAGPGRQAAD